MTWEMFANAIVAVGFLLIAENPWKDLVAWKRNEIDALGSVSNFMTYKQAKWHKKYKPAVAWTLAIVGNVILIFA